MPDIWVTGTQNIGTRIGFGACVFFICTRGLSKPRGWSTLGYSFRNTRHRPMLRQGWCHDTLDIAPCAHAKDVSPLPDTQGLLRGRVGHAFPRLRSAPKKFGCTFLNRRTRSKHGRRHVRTIKNGFPSKTPLSSQDIFCGQGTPATPFACRVPRPQKQLGSVRGRRRRSPVNLS